MRGALLVAAPAAVVVEGVGWTEVKGVGEDAIYKIGGLDGGVGGGVVWVDDICPL